MMEYDTHLGHAYALNELLPQKLHAGKCFMKEIFKLNLSETKGTKQNIVKRQQDDDDGYKVS